MRPLHYSTDCTSSHTHKQQNKKFKTIFSCFCSVSDSPTNWPTDSKSNKMKSRDTNLWLIKSSSGGRVKVKTRCVREHDHPTLRKNQATTRTWPVIHRSPNQYDYEALYKIDSTSNSDLNAYDQDSDQSLDAATSYTQRKMHAQTETPNRTCCMATRPVIYLFVTLLVTTGTTALLCGAIMSDHWEQVTWDRTALERLTHNTSNSLQWQLDGRVAAVTVSRELCITFSVVLGSTMSLIFVGISRKWT